jgi:hypothetical protein
MDWWIIGLLGMSTSALAAIVQTITIAHRLPHNRAQ